jgi:hypothetical protein
MTTGVSASSGWRRIARVSSSPGHAEVGEHDVGAIGHRSLEGGRAVRRVQHGVPGPGEQPGEDRRDVLVVLGDEYYGHVRSGTLGG